MKSCLEFHFQKTLKSNVLFAQENNFQYVLTCLLKMQDYFKKVINRWMFLEKKIRSTFISYLETDFMSNFILQQAVLLQLSKNTTDQSIDMNWYFIALTWVTVETLTTWLENNLHRKSLERRWPWNVRFFTDSRQFKAWVNI